VTSDLATLALVAAGGAAGALLRHVAGVLLFFGVRPLPEATLAVNVLASLLLGALTGAGVAEPWMALLGVGLSGALSTWSSLALEIDRLVEQGRTAVAVEYAATTLAAGVGAAFLGFWGASALA
jgi:fluoride exporter